MLSVMMISVVCGAVLISAVSALYQARPPLYQYGPRHPGTYGGAGGHGGGGVDPLTLLLLQKNGGTGNASVGYIGIKFFFLCRWYQQPPSSSINEWWTRWEEGRHQSIFINQSAWRRKVC